MNIQAKSGYKIVKVAFRKYEEIPEDWDVKLLGNLGTVLGGGTPDSKNKEYWNGEIPWAVPTDITSLDGNFIEKTNRNISKKGFDSSSTNLLKKDSVLITSRATIGKYAINTVPMTTNQGFQSLVCNNNTDNLFILYAIQSNKNKLLRFANGTTFLEISNSNMKKIKISIPSLPEQQKIVSFLSNVDDAIQNTNQLIQQTQLLNKGLMQKLLTKGIGHTKFKKEKWYYKKEIEIPEKWNILPISKFCEKIFLGLATTVDYVSIGGIPLVRARDFSAGKLSFKETRNISKKQHDSLTKYRKAKRGDILVSKSGSLGVCALVDTDKEFSIYESVICLQLITNMVTPEFLIWIMRSYFIQKIFLNFTVGSTVGHVNIADFKKLRIPLPKIDEQKQIASILWNIDSKIQKQMIYKSSLKLLQKGLMQKLLTGKIRVKF